MSQPLLPLVVLLAAATAKTTVRRLMQWRFGARAIKFLPLNPFGGVKF
jgi:hypothetical protein